MKFEGIYLRNRIHTLATAAIILALVLPASAAAHRKHVSGAAKSTSSHKGKKSRAPKKGAWKRHGQQAIDSDRTREIQEALIREHYLSGQPTGRFDESTKQALVRLQGDQGWQTKVVPDSRALIKLGLGPKHDNDLNVTSLNAVAPGKSVEGAGTPNQ